MARSRSSSPARGPTRSTAVSKPTAAPSKPAPTPAASTNNTPAMSQPQSSGGMFSGGGIMSGIAQGMIFGAGSSLGHRAVDSVMGPRQVEHVQVASDNTSSNASTAAMGGNKKCLEQFNNFQNCLKDNDNSVSSCQFYFDMLNQCQREH